MKKNNMVFFEVEVKENSNKNKIEFFRTLFEAMSFYREEKNNGADFLALIKVTKINRRYSNEYLRIEGC